MTRKNAVELGKSEWWKEKTNEEIVQFQLYEERLCMPFDRFHEAVEKVLKRPVYSHEFACLEFLQREFESR